MSLVVSSELIKQTTDASLEQYRVYADSMRSERSIQINSSALGVEALHDLGSTASAGGDMKTARAVESIIQARAGSFDKPVPSFKAFKDVLESFLRHGAIDGWVYVVHDDSRLYPQLVTQITYDEGRGLGRDATPAVTMRTISYGVMSDGRRDAQVGVTTSTHVFLPHDVAKRRVADILSAKGIFKETQQLWQDHMASLKRYEKELRDSFAKQLRITGPVLRFVENNYSRRGQDLSGRRVIHDLQARDFAPASQSADSFIFDSDEQSSGVGNVPEHPVLRVFDLRTHEFLWVHADHVVAYEYDHALREKIVLPATHRDLLDILTSDIGAFVEDIIEGKSAGNVIMCKGTWGVGKTLTAEVYAELIERPLYSIHAGSLGTSPSDIEKNLQMIFQRGKRWGCVLLLDEADVFVAKRSNASLELNAVVAVFLRSLEYFDGLMFCTTNRPDDVDEAFVARCAAIINFDLPGPEDAAAIWRVMSNQFKAPLTDRLIKNLVQMFPEIAPRDIKMLFRLALRMSGGKAESLNADTFRRCAMFRAIKISER